MASSYLTNIEVASANLTQLLSCGLRHQWSKENPKMATACNVPEFTLLSTTATFDCTPTPFCKANQRQFPVDASAFLMVATTLSFQNETDCRCNACIRIMRNSLASRTAYGRAICGAPRLASATLIAFANAFVKMARPVTSFRFVIFPNQSKSVCRYLIFVFS